MSVLQHEYESLHCQYKIFYHQLENEYKKEQQMKLVTLLNISMRKLNYKRMVHNLET